MVVSTRTKQTPSSTQPLPQRETANPSAWVDELFSEIAIDSPTSKPKTPKSKKTRQTKAKSKKTTDLNQVAPLALSMSRGDRFQLIEMLKQFNELEAAELEEAKRTELIQQESANRKLSKGRSAHVELKVINGCGPYRYLRWWCGATHKSTYMGKD